MKICPQCQQTYTDTSLNFCLNDGSPLNEMSGSSSGVQDGPLPETVLINQPRATNPNQPFGTTQQPNFGSTPPPPNDWSTPATPSYTMQPKQKSRSWVWVVGILGVLVLVCGGGLVGLFAWMANLDPAANNSNTEVSNTNSSTNNTTTNTNWNSKSNSTTTASTSKVDFAQWKTEDSDSVKTSYSNGEFTMQTKKEGYFYVLIARNFKSQDSTSKLTVKNTDSKPTDVGFGILVHSSSIPLNEDYGFLIDSEKKRYRIVKHSLKTESIIKDWQSFSGIKSGSAENVLEIRDSGNKIDFYINGQFVTSQSDTITSKDGVVGIYSSDGIPIAFSNLEVSK